MTHHTTPSGPKQFFFHLLMIGTLYTSITAAVALLFQYANVWFPDPLETYRENIFQAIRWSSSVLLVAFPVFLYCARVIARDLAAHPTLRETRTRRWLLHFTIFAAAVVLIGDVIALIHVFYGGELTLRFVVKSAVLLVVALVVLGYYRQELTNSAEKSVVPRTVALIVGTVLLAAVIGGVFVAGTPAERRRILFDERRVSDLSALENTVIDYWQRTEALPESLELLSSIVVWKVPLADPLTGESYEYEIRDDLSFTLCATFDTDTTHATTISSPRVPILPNGSTPPGAVGVWAHPKGKHCLERTIDPAYYRYDTPIRQKEEPIG